MLDPDDIEWLEEQVKVEKFSSRSHAIRVAVKKLIESEKAKEG